MKRTVLGAILGAGIVTVAAAFAEQRADLPGQLPAATPAVAGGAELIAVSASLGDKGQMLTVIDPRQKVMCVYQIEFATGKIALRSARKIQWDLQMTYLNNENPLPQDIRSMLEQR